MLTAHVLLALAVFGACAVESVEALTLVLASATVSRRSALEGTAAGLAVLSVAVGVLGPTVLERVPLNGLRVVIGGLLLVLGLGWLRKAVLRASGHKALHDEDAIYAATRRSLAERGPVATGAARGRDGAAFLVAMKGVLLEGTEVVLIVLGLGSSAHELGLAAAMAGAAAVLIALVGMLVARQLSEVPENTMKLVVGVMLTSFGLFWTGEGDGLSWPGRDLSLLLLVAVVAVVTAGTTAVMRRALPSRDPT